jgi:hypothetical protein
VHLMAWSPGTMEGGRQADIAKGILAAKNVPYVVAAPLLIQVQGPGLFQSRLHVLYACICLSELAMSLKGHI